MTCPCWSIARYGYVQRPDSFTYVSSTNHRSPGAVNGQVAVFSRPWTGGMAVWPGSFDELGGEALHPPIDGHVINGDTVLGQQCFDVTEDRPYRRYQRTAIEITSGGNRKPANTEDEPDDVTKPGSRPPRSTNATEPSSFRYPC
jgi:hypothetical protein